MGSGSAVMSVSDRTAASRAGTPGDADPGGAAAPPVLTYDGISDSIPGLPTRADLVRRADTAGLTEILGAHIRERRLVLFMPNDVQEANDYVGGVPEYRLHLFGVLLNGAKAHVILEGVDVFFDVRVPDPPPDRPDGFSQAFGAHLCQLLGAGLGYPGRRAFPIRGFGGKRSRGSAASFQTSGPEEGD